MSWRAPRLRRAAARSFLTGVLLAGSSFPAAQEASQHPPQLPSSVLVPAAPKSKPAPAPAAQLAPACAAPAAPAPTCCGFDWSKVPPVRVFPRPGNFFIPPSGPGYYSVLDLILGKCRENPPKFPYGPLGPTAFSFFDADWRYLDDPKNTQHDILDPFHRIHLGDNWLLDTGGEFRWRHMDEFHSRLGVKRNNYDLYRVREYADLWYQDLFRVYVEGIFAQSVGQDLASLPIDVNKADFLNLFIDLKLATIQDHNAYLRVGRQESLLGSQRLISPLDWANTRRTFQGVRVFRQGEKFDVDAFWVQPVIPNPNRLDSVDNNQNFAGLWTTYRPEKGHFLDAYYLVLDNTNKVTQQGIDRAPYTVHTLGARYTGDHEGFLWDGEAVLQLGDRGKEEILAGAATGGLGWINQLFPFGHYYFGFADQVGRQNIQDINAHLFLYPAKWITLNAQYHHFFLDESRDALYNPAGNAIRRSASGAAGNDVGDEVDFLANFHLDAHSDLLFGYSKLFGGHFLAATGAARSTDLLYFQYSFKW